MLNVERLYLTQRDYEVLESISDKYPKCSHIEFLDLELARADVVTDDEIPADVVTLNSRVRVVDETNSKERVVTVVPPNDLSSSDGKVSVLSPLGVAVIGLSEGQVISWPKTIGQSRRFRVEKVLYQPEAAQKTVRSGRSRLSQLDLNKGYHRRLIPVEEYDPVEQASLESFPASDAPGWRL